jgi:hypothetical protein
MQTRHSTFSDEKEVIKVVNLLIDCLVLNKIDPTYASNAMLILIHDMLVQNGVGFEDFVRIYKIQWQQLDNKQEKNAGHK